MIPARFRSERWVRQTVSQRLWQELAPIYYWYQLDVQLMLGQDVTNDI